MIVTCVQRGNYVYVYGEGNRQLCSQFGTLHGYTGSTFAVKRGDYVYVYDERNRLISSQFSK